MQKTARRLALDEAQMQLLGSESGMILGSTMAQPEVPI